MKIKQCVLFLVQTINNKRIGIRLMWMHLRPYTREFDFVKNTK